MGLSATHTPLPCDAIVSFWSVKSKQRVKKYIYMIYILYKSSYMYILYITHLYLYMFRVFTQALM